MGFSLADVCGRKDPADIAADRMEIFCGEIIRRDAIRKSGGVTEIFAGALVVITDELIKAFDRQARRGLIR